MMRPPALLLKALLPMLSIVLAALALLGCGDGSDAAAEDPVRKVVIRNHDTVHIVYAIRIVDFSDTGGPRPYVYKDTVPVNGTSDTLSFLAETLYQINFFWTTQRITPGLPFTPTPISHGFQINRQYRGDRGSLMILDFMDGDVEDFPEAYSQSGAPKTQESRLSKASKMRIGPRGVSCYLN
ncbi:MAG: hypothetical protein ABIW76_12895 [Fibrobacteria bacterium]